MFKVEKPEYVNKTFRIDKKLLEKLEAIAQKENISVNALVVQCCEYAINDMNSGNEDHS
ncbi:toxin-antitoxin system HicB family antitoxin [Butyrivibrio sp.]|uniref:toxin-antitoxin system HicB family antitoxin n=1 Tax=Butyrivibrio sp. TaxID=28121 RepID=UPI0025C32FD1|nr:toxin-antitoxin system HicB family antitoxin [Butyrivibrio sp.]MBQ9303996.1 toxin-antitoxin system HicB family antitoxin [Butyrivibrio sp.]